MWQEFYHQEMLVQPPERDLSDQCSNVQAETQQVLEESHAETFGTTDFRSRASFCFLGGSRAGAAASTIDGQRRAVVFDG